MSGLNNNVFEIFGDESNITQSPIPHPNNERRSAFEAENAQLREAGKINHQIAESLNKEDSYGVKIYFERYQAFVDPNEDEAFRNSVLKEIGFQGDINEASVEEISTYLHGPKAEKYRKYQQAIASISKVGGYLLNGSASAELFESIYTEEEERSTRLFELAKAEFARSNNETAINELEANFKYVRSYVQSHKTGSTKENNQINTLS